MSKTVDERVVSMQFDNKQFESNVKTSMSTIDKLKQKLNFSGAAKGMQALSTSTHKMVKDSQSEFESYKSGIFSIGDAWRKMWSSLEWDVANKLKKTFNDLFITPVSSGFSEYELKMQSIQTIMMSTGESIDTVNKYLNELNEYSDKTIYSFQDMTSNIGKFTNAGVKLEDAVKAIQGISNEAAVSGANANEASRAMYNFSQALSAGYVKLIDWKSIENANMATVEFKNELIKTALALGTITEASDGMYQTLSGNTFNATKNFNEVFQDQWMTSEVLVQTLGRYADETTDIGKKAFAAAQEIKTFSQMMDTLKETAQSGWARTWEIMFGSLPEAKKLWTTLGEAIGSVIGKIDDTRNAVLESAFGKTVVKMSDGFKGIIGGAKEVVEPVNKAVDALEDLDTIVNKVIKGDFGNGEDRFNKLTDAGQNYYRVQNKVNEVLGDSHRYTKEQIEAQDKLIGKTKKTTETTGEQKEETIKLTDEQKNNLKGLMKMTEEQLRSKGYTDEQIQALKDLGEQANKLGIPMDKFIDNLDEINGKWLFLESFANIGRSIAEVFKAAGAAFNDLFGFTKEGAAEGLFSFLGGFHKVTADLLNGIKNNASELTRIFKGLFAVIDIFATIFGSGIKMAFEAINALLSAFGVDILDVAAYLADGIVVVRNWIKAHNPIVYVFKKIGEFLKWVCDNWRTWIDSLKESENVGKDIIAGLVNGIWSGIKTVADKMRELGLRIIKEVKKVLGIHSPSTEFYEIGINIIQGLVNGIKGGFETLKKAFNNVVTWMKERFENINWGSVASVALSGGLVVVLAKLMSFIGLIKKPVETVMDLIKQVPDILEGIADFTKKFNKVLGGISFNLKASAILKLAQAIGILALAIIALGVAFNFIDTADMWQGFAMVAILTALFGTIMVLMTVFQKEGKNININSISFTLSGIAIALLGLAACVAILGSIKWEQLWHAGVIVGGYILLVTAMIAVMNLTSKEIMKIDASGNGTYKALGKMSGFFIQLGIAMLLMAATLKIISSMYQTGDGANNDALWFAVGIVGGFMVLTGAMIGLSAFAKHDFKGVALIFGSIGWALVDMAVAIAILGHMNYAEMWRGVNAVIALLGALTIMVGIMAKMIYVAEFPKLSAMFIALGGALLMMSVAVAILAAIDPNKLQNAFIACASLMLLTGIIAGVLGNSTAMAGFGKFVLSLGVAMLTLAIAIGILSIISWEGLGKAVLGLAALGVFIGIMLSITKTAGEHTHKAALVFLGIGVAVLALASAMLILSLLSPEAIFKGIVAITAMGIVLALISTLSKFATGSNQTIIALAIAIGVLAASIAVLSLFNFERIMGAVAALSAVIAVFAILVGVSKLAKGTMGSLIVLTVAIGVLAGALALLSIFEPSQLKGAAASLSTVMIVFTIFMVVMTKVAKNCKIYKTARTSLIIMTVLIGVIGGIIALVCAFDPTGSGAVSAALGISLLLMALLGAMTILKSIKKIPQEGLVSLLAMSAIVAVIGVIIAILTAWCYDADAAIKMALSMSVLILALSMSCVLLGAVGIMGPGAFLGLAVLGALIVGLGLLLAGIGALMTYVPEAEQFLDKGIVVLEKIGYALGSFFGNIIGGFLESIIDGLSGLEQLGTSLSNFMEKLQPFIDGVKQMDESTANAVKALTGMILSLCAANILDAVAGWIKGKSSIEDFANQIVPFGKAIVTFSKTVAGNIDESAVTAAANAGKILTDMAATLPKTGGVVQWFMGQGDLATFSTQITLFGDAIVGFSKKVAGNIDESAIVAAANAGKTMVELQNKLPKTGGVVQWFAGQQDLGTFGTNIEIFGNAMVAFSNAITAKGENGGFSAEAVVAAANAGSALAALANNLPESTSVLWGAFKKGSDIEGFAKNLPTLGKGMAKFSTALTKNGGFSADAVAAAGNAAKGIAEFCSIDVGKFKSVTKEFSKLTNISTIANAVNFDGLTKFGKKLETLAKNGIKLFIQAFENSSKKVRKAVESMLDSSLKELDNVYDDFYEDGENAAIGFANGMLAKKAKVAGIAAGIAAAAKAAIEEALRIKSPSRETFALGAYTGEGFVNGLITYQNAAANAGSDMAKYATDGLTEAISQIRDTVDADMDVQPTIRPVLDLSDIKNGAGRLSGLLDASPSVGVEANLSAIKRLSQNNQNGVNDDVVSAIEALGEKFSGMSGNTYTINGITYDDGSNVQAAIETLVRAAKIERRI